MSKNKTDPSTLSEAIEKLETAGTSKVQDFKQILEKDYLEIRKALDDLKPHLDGLKDKVGSEAAKTKDQVEVQIKQNPWLAIGAVGLLAFVIGWIFGSNKKE
jgi:ElaB/YqjD/DUF883 family membrane-anchored ribosome-binding protein